MICIAGVLLSRSKECLDSRFVDHFHVLIIKEQPMVVAFHKTNIMPMVRTTSHVYDDCKQRVLCVCIFHRVVQFQLQREDNTIR